MDRRLSLADRLRRGDTDGVYVLALLPVLLSWPVHPPTAQSIQDERARRRPSPHLRVDAFGYRPKDAKVAVARVAQVGFDGPESHSLGPVLEVRREHDDSVAFSGSYQAWRSGAVHTQSGDQCWSVDFSSLKESGHFYLFDPLTREASEVFEIRPGVYRPILRAALRMFTHQRCGVDKQAPFIRPCWNDSACHVGASQDLQCRYVLDGTNAALERDLAGGWHDAGDYNKYVNYADDAVHALLEAYEIAPQLWSDEMNLPESGNGLPDILDEVAFELEWFMKMQGPSGALAHKLSVLDWTAPSPPSTDVGARYYGPDTASATLSGCGVFAHAALVLGSQPTAGAKLMARRLEQAAFAAWDWLQLNPGLVPSYYNNQGFVSAACEDSAYAQDMNYVRAAALLFELTGGVTFQAFVDQGYTRARFVMWNQVFPWDETAQSALLRYAALPQATPNVASAIQAIYTTAVSGPGHLGHYLQEDDPYRAYLADQDYTWGSNRTKSQQGDLYFRMVREGFDRPNQALYRAAGMGYLHYLHGVNPMGLCYLTHMDAQGGECSVRETYHCWFADGTQWDHADAPIGPPPGYLVGGPNPTYQPGGSYSGPPLNQPIQKSYRDWNTGWPENSWQVTECHIPYQAAYVRALAGALR